MTKDRVKRVAAMTIASVTLGIMIVHVNVPPPAAAVLATQRTLAGFDGLATSQDGSGVVVAVVDTGVDLDHPAIAGRLVPGWDFVDSDDQPDDPNGHGTHVAGIVAESSGSGAGGLAPGARIMPVRVLDADGNGSLTAIASGIQWAADHGATVINLSFGDSGRLDRIRKDGPVAAAIRTASDRAVVIVAAGNDSQFEQIFRANVPAIVVVAVDDTGVPAAFTNIGDPRTLAAPGIDVVSTAPPEPSVLFPDGTDGNAALSGTSMAAPFVSAAAAVVLQAGAAPEEVAELLRTTAQPNADPRTGAGLVNAKAAADAVPAAPDPESEPSVSRADDSMESASESAPASDDQEWFSALAILAIFLLALVSVSAAVYAIRRR